MYHTTITNPATSRRNKVRVFPIATKEAIALVKESGLKNLSWALLNQPESLEDCAAEMGGDASSSNFALSIFENALDWQLGLAVVQYLKAFAHKYPGKQPKMLRVAVNQKGDVFCLNADHSIAFS